ncbi:Peptidoglycan-binding (PGRP) domain of peptidoglycan hydrolases-containing protein [Lysobacter sp. yr284]|uniref:XVIPCD domain-containing protein n=1 Tax=Lysobacter sp. yr284 TaxID=1761791 RepID=UPI00089A8C26|nr:XVIPCD domain-containing protein [Lysobacter sp. yr284]SDY19862.1 Peptidoglycan-binding (PGRP) domain of peptidoglycan hydrolases-containing protein [Lysobacter sp. yr284]
MSYQDVMNTILPPQQGRAPHITGHYGEHRGNGPHGGSDFNYVGGQAGVNLTHPTIHSPVAGTVEFVGGRYGTVTIVDGEGNRHQLLHTQSQSVVVGQRVEPGTAIGTMGGRGPNGEAQYAQHVHYQMKDAQGNNLNPEDFWNRRQHVGGQNNGGHSAAPPAAAGADGVLRQGERGAEVRAMQETLNRLGYRDDQGRPLAADGDFGERSRQAVARFQRENGLREDGVAGPRTLDALREAGPRRGGDEASLISNPNHPDNRMYRQALEGLERLGPDAGFRTPQDRERAAATLTYEARMSGLKDINHVVQNVNGNGVFAVEGGLNDPAHHRVYADKQQAMSQSVEQTSQRLAQDAPARQADQPAQEKQQTQQHQPPRMTLG